MAGRKNDSGKPRWTLMPFSALQNVVRVLEFGARKYSVDNWKSVENGVQRYMDAALRHIIAHNSGEELDPESGLPHTAHAMCSLAFHDYLKEEERKHAKSRSSNGRVRTKSGGRDSNRKRSRHGRSNRKRNVHGAKSRRG